jgi:hypothetical protein
MIQDDCTLSRLLLSFVGLLAERHAYGPSDGFEFVLWDDLLLENTPRQHILYSGGELTRPCLGNPV